MKIISLLLLFTCACFYSNDTNNVEKDSKNIQPNSVSPKDIDGIVAFWDFQEESGSDKVSKGGRNLRLTEMNGPIKRAEDGVFGPYSADIEWGQWLRIKREEAPALNIHGENQQVSMVAWIKRESDRVWQYVAGMWSEGDKRFKGQSYASGERAPTRQFAIFINGAWQNDYTTYERKRSRNQTLGYISPYGGATPDHPFAFDYATGGTVLEMNRWYMIAFTYDGEWIKVYVDGKLDTNGNYNPFKYDGPIFNGGENGADFTVAQRNHPKWTTYPEGVPEYEEGFDGKIGGLAVYNRALTADEILVLYNSSIK